MHGKSTSHLTERIHGLTNVHWVEATGTEGSTGELDEAATRAKHQQLVSTWKFVWLTVVGAENGMGAIFQGQSRV